MESGVFKLIRVARDGSAVIAQVGEGEYALIDRESHAVVTDTDVRSLAELRPSWRRVVGSDNTDTGLYQELVTATQTNLSVTASAGRSARQVRVPTAVRTVTANALAATTGKTDVSYLFRDVAQTLSTSAAVSTTYVADIASIAASADLGSSEWELTGGEAGRAWIKRLNVAAEVEPTNRLKLDSKVVYYGGGDDPDSLQVDALYSLDRDSNLFSERTDGKWLQVGETLDRPFLVQLDYQSANAIAEFIDNPEPDKRYFELQSLNPIEWNLFNLAQHDPELNENFLDRITAAADQTWTAERQPQERTETAGRQVRDSGGQFLPGEVDEKGQRLRTFAKAHFETPLELEANPASVIGDFILAAPAEAAPTEPGPTDEPQPEPAPPADEPVAAAGEPAPQTETVEAATPDTVDGRPLYLAVVDAGDTGAVLDVIAVVPAKAGTSQGPTAWRRSNGAWVSAPDLLADLQGVTPPPVVEMKDDATVKDVLSQVDTHDQQEPDKQDGGSTIAASADPTAKSREKAADKGHALKDGSFPINDVPDLKKAIHAFGRASDDKKAAVKKHIKRRARALGKADLIPDSWKTANTVLPLGMWGENGELVPIQAAGVPGVADTPKDHRAAARLARYWERGEGALKIGWNTDGDWYRCVAHLSKYMGERAKGYCTLRHKGATGFWPGHAPGESAPRVGKRAIHASAADGLQIAVFEQSVLAMSITAAAVEAAQLIATEDYEVPVDPFDIEPVGGQFSIPVLLPEAVASGDNRTFDYDSISLRWLPLPLLWQIQTGDGHNGSVVVGRMDYIEPLPGGGVGNVVGVFDTGPWGREAERLVRGGFLRGVSADLDMFEASVEEPEELEDRDELASEDADVEEAKRADDSRTIKNDKVTVSKARVMAATLLPKPAFQECYIVMTDAPNVLDQEPGLLEDGLYEETPSEPEQADIILASLAASAAPVKPPRYWFNNPELDKATPLTITDDGQVFGHIASWSTDHIGLPRATKPPKSASNYAYFRTGMLRTEEGEDVAVGQLTLAGGHASMTATAADAVKHYDDTASGVADVAAGEDRHGIWVAGALRPGVTAEQVRVLRASAPSGDWRPINGRLELVAVCQVNVPGFPVARAFVASGHVTALVAAGARFMAELRDEPVSQLDARVASLEALEVSRAREAALARVAATRSQHREALVAAANAARERIRGTDTVEAGPDTGDAPF